MVFYFTGTGNDLAVARAIAEALDEPTSSIPQVLAQARIAYPRFDDQGILEPAKLTPQTWEADRIVVVTPVYGHELPYLVELFLRSFRFETPYLAFVLTYGNRTGTVVEYLESVCSECGMTPAYIQTLLMVDNWLPDYDIEVQRAMDKGTVPALARIVDELARGIAYLKPVTETDRAAHRELLASGFRFRPWHIVDLLTVTDRCVGCGICVQLCPSGCMRMDGERAVREALTGWGCSACLACINACPSSAFECSFGEKNPAAHYRHPEVSVADLIRANTQR